MTHNTHNPPRTSRAFATIVALSLIALMGAAMVSLMARMKNETAVTRRIGIETQLRQMLLVGTMTSSDMVLTRNKTAGRSDVWNVPLPSELAGRGGLLTLRRIGGREGLEVRIRIDAVLGGRTMRQTLRYVRARRGWGLAEAMLEGKRTKF